MTNIEQKALALVERLEEWEWTLRAVYKAGDTSVSGIKA